MTVSFWYISATLDDGKASFDGPYVSEKEANDMGFKLFPGLMFKKHKYGTRDKAKATSMWKHDLATSVGAQKALRPVRHVDKTKNIPDDMSGAYSNCAACGKVCSKSSMQKINGKYYCTVGCITRR